MSARLSLVMIVRDEATMAPDFIQSVHGLWDELVVVDTGSTDATVALFQAAGARVLHHTWQDDFSLARNASLDAATGDWVLVLDADERVDPDFIAELRERIEDPQVGALALRLSHALPYGHRRESRALRAWRRDALVRFHFAVHEDASASVAQLLARTGTSLVTLDTAVDHLGFVRTRTAAKDKKARDVRLLRGCIVDEPFDFHSRLKLLELARASHDGPLWQHSAREATDALEQAGRDALALRPLGGELIALIAEGLFTASSSAGLAYLDDWAPRLLPSAPFFHQRGVVHEHLGDLVKARADYERCLTLGDELGDGQDLVRPRLGLARLCLAAGDAELAAAHAAAALDHSPRDPEALVAVVTLRRALEGPRALDDWEAEHRARHPACPERDWAIGEALYTLGDFKGAVAKLRLGAGVPPSGPAAVRLGQALLADGQLEAAEASCRALLAAEPEAGLGVLVFDLMRGDSTELDLDLTAETANAAMRHWIDALLASKNVTWRKKLAKNVDAVQELFPWLGEYLARRAG